MRDSRLIITVFLVWMSLLVVAASPISKAHREASLDCREAADPDLEKMLREARAGIVEIQLISDITELNIESITDSSEDHCPNTIHARKNSPHNNTRAACPW